MSPNSHAHVLVYRALDQVLGDRTISRGTSRAMHAAIDSMRTSSAPAEHIRAAENIAVEIHLLQWALQKSDVQGSRSALERLKMLSAKWIDMRIRSGSADAGRRTRRGAHEPASIRAGMLLPG